MANGKLLIVEDNDIKLRRIVSVLNEISITEFDRVSNLKAAQLYVRNFTYAGILLDMTFHIIENKIQSVTLEALAGLQLMQYMDRLGIEIPTIVVTQHTVFQQPGTPAIRGVSKLDKLLRGTFPGIYRGTVLMTDGDQWRSDLVRLLETV